MAYLKTSLFETGILKQFLFAALLWVGLAGGLPLPSHWSRLAGWQNVWAIRKSF